MLGGPIVASPDERQELGPCLSRRDESSPTRSGHAVQLEVPSVLDEDGDFESPVLFQSAAAADFVPASPTRRSFLTAHSNTSQMSQQIQPGGVSRPPASRSPPARPNQTYQPQVGVAEALLKTNSDVFASAIVVFTGRSMRIAATMNRISAIGNREKP